MKKNLLKLWRIWWHLDDSNHWCIRHPILCIKSWQNYIKWGIERISNGYCEYDTYDIQDWFFTTIEKMLKEFQKQKPLIFNECYLNAIEKSLVNKDIDDEMLAIEESEAIIDALITMAHKINNAKDVDMQIYNEREFFELFQKYLHELWW